MTVYRLIILLVIGLCCMSGNAANSPQSTDSLLNQLDRVISERAIYLEKKEARLAELHRNLASATADKERFDILGNLFDEYHSFNADSAYAMSLRQEILADRIGEKNLILNAKMNRANILSATGMYTETLSLIDSISKDELPDYLRAYYFHTNRTVYGNLAEYSAFEPERKYYERLTDAFRDSLLSVNEPNSLFHTLIRADQLNFNNRPKEAIDLLCGYIDEHELSEHDKAICAWTLSESYGKLGDKANQKRQLLLSAISDMKSAVREYVSLRQLALLLYQEGDLDRAYRFLTIAVDDAAKCNARQRIVELNASYPMVNGIYIETITAQKKDLERTIIIITVLSVILVLLLFYMRKQMKRIAESRKKLAETNDKLNEVNSKLSESNDKLNHANIQLRENNETLNQLNLQLTQSNRRLQEAYSAIAEISELKEVYICQYMDQSLAYIEMLDGYRKTIGKLLGSGKIDELKKLAKSTTIIDDEFKSFYAQFDKTFLNLFPTFVDDFNSLLLPEEAIIPKKAGSLNTELRIFALIRLGITDSDKIAKFLRYSLTTIYNYRTKVRNKAKGDRNQLESEIAKIGQSSSSR